MKYAKGTQAQLDAASDYARLIPKKTYFRSKYGNTIGQVVFKIDNPLNDQDSVRMFSNSSTSSDFHCHEDLEPIND